MSAAARSRDLIARGLLATHVAKNLSVRGYPEARAISNGDEFEDGEVRITDSVHIQVPTIGGGGLNVVRENADDTFNFYPERRDWRHLCADIRDAINGA